MTATGLPNRGGRGGGSRSPLRRLRRLLIGEKAPSFKAETTQADKNKVATPANWQMGEDVIVPPPGSCGAAKERMEQPTEDVRCLDWFLCLKKCPK